jgi:hypothetical protein
MNKIRFFGRQAHLQLLEKRISGLKDGFRQNIAFIGDELVGKSSIIFNFLKKFYDSRFVVVYVETRPESIESFARRFFATMIYNFLSPSGVILQEDLDYLLRKSEKFIPKTVSQVNGVLNAIGRKKKNNIFNEILGVLDVLHEESSKFCVVIFDEFHNLENLGSRNIYREWSKLLITQKGIQYIVISSHKFRAKTILSKDLSLLFGNFEVINIEPFDIPTSEEYLDNKLSGSGVGQGVKDFLVNFTGGYPLYLEMISNALISSPDTDPAILIEELVFETSGALNQRFASIIKRITDTDSSRDLVSVLYLASSGRNKIRDISHILKIQKKDLLLRVSRLLEFDLISRSGDFLIVSDRLFSFWLRFVYKGKLGSLTFDARNQKEYFRNNICAMMEEFIAASGKPITERVNEVLRLFEDEVVQIERKKIRLNHFREIKPLSFGAKGIKDGIIGRSQDCLWIIAFKTEQLTEGDVMEFVKECKKFRSKSQRKIIVTLGSIDQNTRLRAMEEKIWAWDVNRVNEIFDLYFKPRVIA